MAIGGMGADGINHAVCCARKMAGLIVDIQSKLATDSVDKVLAKGLLAYAGLDACGGASRACEQRASRQRSRQRKWLHV